MVCTCWSAAAVTAAGACDCRAAASRTPPRTTRTGTPPGAVASGAARRPPSGRRPCSRVSAWATSRPGGSAATGREPGASGPDGERARPAVEVGHLQQQVAPGQVVPRPHRQGAAEPVQRVERAGEHEPLGDRPARPGPVPQVGERAVRLPGHDPLHLGRADALDVGQRQPDAVAARVGHAGVETQPGARQRLEAAAVGPVAVAGAACGRRPPSRPGRWRRRR